MVIAALAPEQVAVTPDVKAPAENSDVGVVMIIRPAAVPEAHVPV
jgi:hypothetical protein